MNIIEATKQLALGKKIKRKNWNTTYLEGKIQPMICYPKYESYGDKRYGSWSHSTNDILADDWEVVE